MHWKLNRLQYPVYNLGPGTRIGIWVQGCSLKCKGCVSRTLWPVRGGKKINLLRLADQIRKIENHFEGVTITGGEPFDQYESLVAFCAFIKQKTQLTVFCFSGYALEELLQTHPDRLFLKYTDYLLDGRYIREKHENKNVRGSSNQTLYRITGGRPEVQESFFHSDRWSISIQEGNRVFMSGIPKSDDLARIDEEFEKNGLTLRFQR
jgi:anaerobic ribonucleoside-triphosphate reductase activating protein